MKPVQIISDIPNLQVSLVGLCFHRFNDRGSIQFQGIVRGMVNDDHALIHFMDFMVGCLTQIEVVPVAELANGAIRTGRAAGSYQFYRDNDAMNAWYETHQAAMEADYKKAQAD